MRSSSDAGLRSVHPGPRDDGRRSAQHDQRNRREQPPGQERAAVLAGLNDPASTTDLARRQDLAPSTVSAHLAVLREAGLLASRRQGLHVLYGRTPLGDSVVSGA